MAEGTEVGTAYVSIVPSAAGFGATLERQVTGQANLVGQQAGKALGTGITASASGIAKGVVAVLGGIGAAHFMRGALDEAQEAVKVGNLTNAVIKSTGGAAGVTADQVGALATSLSKVAGVDDELIQAGENVLLTFTSVRNQVGAGNDVFNQATRAALDMSAALGTDLQGAVIQLGKALNDPLQGMTALRRVGVSFTEEQQAQVKALQDSGNLLGAQKLILSELNKEFGGAAAANATALDKMHVAVLNAKEAIGTALLPAVNAASAGLTEMLGAFTALPGPVQSVTGAIIGLGAASLAIALITPKIRAARVELEGMGTAGAAASRGLGFLGRASLVVAGAAALVAGLKAVRDKAAELSGHGVGSIPKLTDDVADFLTTGRAVGDLADQFGTGLAGIGKSLKTFTDDQGGFKSIDRLLDPAFTAATADIDSLDKTLAGLVSGGHADAAKQFFAEIVTLAGRQGVSVDDVNRAFNDYGDAVHGAAAEGKLAQLDLKGAGDAADGSATKAEDAVKKWNDLQGALEAVVQSDWSKQLASNLTSALNPVERFLVGTGKNVDDLKEQVTAAKADLASATADLAKFDATGTASDIARIRGQAGDVDAARAKVAQATRRFRDANTELAAAQKSPLASITDNLKANLATITGWLGNLKLVQDKLGGTAGEELAKHLGSLGPQAADAVAEAVKLKPSDLSKIEGLFDQTDKVVSDAASGAFELNMDQAAKPGETLAEIIVDRYQKTLTPKFTVATLAALNQATAAILGAEGAGIPHDVAGEPGPGEARTPPQPATLGPVAPTVPPAATPAPLINVPGFTMPGPQPAVTIPFQVTSTADPRQIAAEVGDHVAWRLAPKATAAL